MDQSPLCNPTSVSPPFPLHFTSITSVRSRSEERVDVPSPQSSGISADFDGPAGASAIVQQTDKSLLTQPLQKSRRKQVTPSRCLSPQNDSAQGKRLKPNKHKNNQTNHPGFNGHNSTTVRFSDPAVSRLDNHGIKNSAQSRDGNIFLPPTADMTPKIPPFGEINLGSGFETQVLAQQWMWLYMQNLTLQHMLQHRGGPPLLPPPPSVFAGISPIFPQLSPNFSLPQAPPPTSPEAKENEEKANTEAAPEKPQLSFDCRYCNRHLTSNVYLKRHLAKKHGVSVPFQEPREGTQVQSGDGLKERKILLKLRIPKQPASTSAGADSSTEPAHETPYLKKLLEKDVGKSTVTFQPSALFEGTPNESVLTDSSINSSLEEKVASGLDSSSDFKSIPFSDTPSSIDLDLHCMICNREYCSKYFLRKHLQKVHGLSTVDYLIHVRLHHPQIYERYAKMPIAFGGESQLLPSHMLEALKPARQNWCIYCSKNFCNKYFFRDHLLKKHQLGAESESVLSKADIEKKPAKKPGHKCDTCLKDYSSKYFLKIHRQRAHGIEEFPPMSMSQPFFCATPVADLATRNDPPNSDEKIVCHSEQKDHLSKITLEDTVNYGECRE